MNKQHQVETERYSIYIQGIFLLIFTCLACKNDSEDTVIYGTSNEYLKFASSTENQLDITPESTYHYKLITKGEDPYVCIMPLTKIITDDKVVFTFKYMITEDINRFQIFFGSPVTESRSVTTGIIPAAASWTTFSIDLGEPIKEFAWGKAGDFLRLDFGNKAGISIQIKNMQLRVRNAEEEALALAYEEMTARNLQLESDLKKYLDTSYDAQITEVNVTTSVVSVTGHVNGEEGIGLYEVTPYENVTQMTGFEEVYKVNSSSFTVDFERYITRNGFTYDRALSKWVLVKAGSPTDELISHAHYADRIEATRNLTVQPLSGKKGLGGYSVNRGFQEDLEDLGISSVTVNIPITEFMYMQPPPNAVAHTYGGMTYYFDRIRIEELDRTMLTALNKNIVVAAIILIQRGSESADMEVGELLQHPDYTDEGIFTMPNLTTPAGLNCYAAALDFLANRYCSSDNTYGRIHHWILHNEVDAGYTWTNMGEKPMLVYLDTYFKSLRLCYNIIHNYDSFSEVFASFTHSWAEPCGSGYYYATKDMLEALIEYSNTEGDFKWGLAYHPYPEDLFEPKTWNDQKAVFSLNTPLVTFKNLEVLDTWIRKDENKYRGTVKRTVWLSENGTNSKSYGETDLNEQAAGFAYAWKKLKTLDGIDAIQWHNWIDNRYEGGLRIGLRRFPDDPEYPGGTKPVWYAYQAADTDQEDSVFEAYKTIIGISSWSEVVYNGIIF